MTSALVCFALFMKTPESETLTVFAAASLKEVFTTVGKQFERDNPGTTVSLNFAGSQTLAAQIGHGAPADVFASASAKNLDDTKPGRGASRVFARNRLTVIVRKGQSNLQDVKGLARAPRIVLADVSVPAGKYGEEFLLKASKSYGADWLKVVKSHVVSRELDVRSVLTKVTLGEADAGVVYISDSVAAKGRVTTVPIPDVLNVIADYPIAVMPRSQHRRLAKLFIDSLFTAESRMTFLANGFLPPVRSVQAGHGKSGTKLVSSTARKSE